VQVSKESVESIGVQNQREKERVDELHRLKQRREELLAALAEAERRYDLARAADLEYGALQELEQAIAKFEEELQENSMLSEVVGPKQIAEVCKRPVEKCWSMLHLY
jgi:ATP-dependent Clp protease ATP-binding subunit ClpB